MRKNTKIEMPYGTGESLAGEFIKAYTEVQLDVEMKRKQCFVNYHCSSDCPNAEYEMADLIASNSRQLKCKQCRYNTGRCADCLFEHSKECPEYKESKEDVE